MAISTVDELQREIADLKREIQTLVDAASRRASQAASDAQPYVDDAQERLRQAAGVAREQGRAVVDTVKENPVPAASIALTAGLLGLAIGYFVGSAGNRPAPRGWL